MTYSLGNGSTHDHNDHCSEVEPGRWNKCLPCALVMLVRAAGLIVPSTVAEATALFAAAGYSGDQATSLEGLRPAFIKRYGISFTISRDPNPENVILPGRAAAMVGSMGAFPKGHRLRKPDPDFDGIHGIFAAKGPASPPGFLWDNPLYRESLPYAGEMVTEAELQKFYNAAGAVREIGWLVSGIALSGGGNQPVQAPVDMSANLFYGRAVKTKAAKILEAPGGKVVGSAPAGTLLPYIGTTTDGAFRVIAYKDRDAYIEIAGVDSIVTWEPPQTQAGQTPTVPPAPPADCTAEIEAAIAADRAKSKVGIIYEGD